MTKISIPSSWAAGQLASYLTGKGYTCVDGNDDGVTTTVNLAEDLDAGQRDILKADLLSDFSPVIIETV